MKAFAAGVLHHQIDILGRIDALVQLDDVGVVQFGQYLNFSDGLLFPLDVEELVSIILLYCDLLAALPVQRLFHFGVCTSSDQLAHRVILDFGTPGCGELALEVEELSVGHEVARALFLRSVLELEYVNCVGIFGNDLVVAQSILDPTRVDFVGRRTVHRLTIPAIISVETRGLLGLVLDQVLSESIHRIVIRLFPKAGTTRLLSIEVIEGQPANLEVRSPILILLVLHLR